MSSQSSSSGGQALSGARGPSAMMPSWVTKGASFTPHAAGSSPATSPPASAMPSAPPSVSTAPISRSLSGGSVSRHRDELEYVPTGSTGGRSHGERDRDRDAAPRERTYVHPPHEGKSWSATGGEKRSTWRAPLPSSSGGVQRYSRDELLALYTPTLLPPQVDTSTGESVLTRDSLAPVSSGYDAGDEDGWARLWEEVRGHRDEEAAGPAAGGHARPYFSHARPGPPGFAARERGRGREADFDDDVGAQEPGPFGARYRPSHAHAGSAVAGGASATVPTHGIGGLHRSKSGGDAMPPPGAVVRHPHSRAPPPGYSQAPARVHVSHAAPEAGDAGEEGTRDRSGWLGASAPQRKWGNSRLGMASNALAAALRDTADGAQGEEAVPVHSGPRSHGGRTTAADVDKNWRTAPAAGGMHSGDGGGGGMLGDDEDSAATTWEMISARSRAFEAEHHARKDVATVSAPAAALPSAAPEVGGYDPLLDEPLEADGAVTQDTPGVDVPSLEQLRAAGEGVHAQAASGAEHVEAAAPAGEDDSGPAWFYTDPSGNVQGPFSQSDMREWFTAGYFADTLPVRCGNTGSFTPLEKLFATDRASAFTNAAVLNVAPTSAAAAANFVATPAVEHVEATGSSSSSDSAATLSGTAAVSAALAPQLAKIQAAQGTHAQMQAHIAAAHKEMQNQMEVFSAANAQLSTLEAEIRELTSAQTQLSAHLHTLHSSHGQLVAHANAHGHTHALAAQMTHTQSEAAKYAAALAQVESKLVASTSTRNQLAANVTIMNQRLTANNERILNAEATARAHLMQLQQLIAQVQADAAMLLRQQQQQQAAAAVAAIATPAPVTPAPVTTVPVPSAPAALPPVQAPAASPAPAPAAQPESAPASDSVASSALKAMLGIGASTRGSTLVHTHPEQLDAAPTMIAKPAPAPAPAPAPHAVASTTQAGGGKSDKTEKVEKKQARGAPRASPPASSMPAPAAAPAPASAPVPTAWGKNVPAHTQAVTGTAVGMRDAIATAAVAPPAAAYVPPPAPAPKGAWSNAAAGSSKSMREIQAEQAAAAAAAAARGEGSKPATPAAGRSRTLADVVAGGPGHVSVAQLEAGAPASVAAAIHGDKDAAFWASAPGRK